MSTHHPRKRFGQHFLTDRRVLGRIVDAIAPQPDDIMVEIGAGEGALTGPLLARVHHLHAIEIDRDLARQLSELHPDKLTVHCADALRFDFESLGEGVRVVGNLPYYISTEVLFRLAEIQRRIKDVHVMLQKEVVERIAAGPSTKSYGRLSVMLQQCFRAKALFDVPPSAFRPPPKVSSTAVALYPRLDAPDVENDTFRRVVTAAFGQRRKKLVNSLAAYVQEADLRSLGLNPSARAENLTGDDFVRVARLVSDRSASSMP
jgi:16S rRNA (adenine1518-N6/adenine1519-N6)-dimethyltransferase